jgi:hypothetical protein
MVGIPATVLVVTVGAVAVAWLRRRRSAAVAAGATAVRA